MHSMRTSRLLGFVGLCARRSEAVGAQVLANVGRVGGVKVGCFTVESRQESVHVIFVKAGQAGQAMTYGGEGWFMKGVACTGRLCCWEGNRAIVSD